jgi:c(7)-type cytochrome triheme protein
MSRFVLAVVLLCLTGCGPAETPKQAGDAVAPQAEVPAPPPVEAAPGSGPAPGPPDTIFFPSEYGNVTFTHRKHFERVNGDCAACHPKIFPMARAPLNYGKARHRSAEEYGTSCATCHGIKATAFAAERNCQKCHEMGRKP